MRPSLHSGAGELYAEGGAGARATVERPMGQQSRVVPIGYGSAVLEPECGENAELLGSALIFMGIELALRELGAGSFTHHSNLPQVRPWGRAKKPTKMGFLPSKQSHSSGGIDCLRVP